MREAHLRRRMRENRRRREKSRQRPLSLSKLLRAIVGLFRKKPATH